MRTFVLPLEPRRLLSSTPTFTVSFDDPGGAFSQWYAPVKGTILAAANDWAPYIDSAASIQISVDFDASLTAPTLATAGFDEQVFFRNGPGYEIDIGNVAQELRTGRDQNGSTPDAEISIRPGALGEFYFDSSAARTASVPDNKIDARSVLLHEIGHALGIFGVGGGPHDSPTGDRLVYDQYVTLDSDGNLFFTGPNAEAAYDGQPVPLSQDDSSHIGNDTGPGADLADDLMSPAIPDGAKRFISAVDLGVLADAGVPMKTTNIPAASVSDVTLTRTGSPGQSATFTVSLSKPSSLTVSIPVQTVSGTALAGKDFTTVSRVLKFAPGETSKSVSVPVLPGSAFDATKTFTLSLGLPTAATLADASGKATLKNGNLATDARHTATFKDSTGNTITINLRGPGVATVTRDSANNLSSISVTGSTTASTLSIRSKTPSTLTGLTIKGSLGALDAPKTNLTGTFKLPGTSTVSLRDLTSATLNFTAANPLTLTARNVTGTTIKTRGSVNSLSLAAATSDDILIGGVSSFAQSKADFANRNAVLKTFTVRRGGTFSDTRISAPNITTATLGSVVTSNNSIPFGLAADSIATLTATTPLSPSLKRTNLKTPQTIQEDDFVVRVL